MSFFQKITTQQYDPLNYRNPEFDVDYDEFKKNVAETEFELREFFFRSISLVPNIDEALRLVLR